MALNKPTQQRQTTMKDWDDEKFLGYMATHSKTERALFRNDYCKRLQAFTGEKPTGSDDEWFT